MRCQHGQSSSGRRRTCNLRVPMTHRSAGPERQSSIGAAARLGPPSLSGDHLPAARHRGPRGTASGPVGGTRSLADDTTWSDMNGTDPD